MKAFSKILYIEDEQLQRDTLERLYAMCQKCFDGVVKFVTASTWEAGLAIMRNGDVDVAVVDLTLPPMHKEETLLEIERHWETLPPIVVLTGNEDPKLRRQSIEAGCDDFLLKMEVNRHPEVLCERVYIAYLRRNRHATKGA